MNRSNPYFRWLLVLVLIANVITSATAWAGHTQAMQIAVGSAPTQHAHCAGMHEGATQSAVEHSGDAHSASVLDLGKESSHSQSGCCTPSSCHCSAPATAMTGVAPSLLGFMRVASVVIVPGISPSPSPALSRTLRPPIL